MGKDQLIILGEELNIHSRLLSTIPHLYGAIRASPPLNKARVSTVCAATFPYIQSIIIRETHNKEINLHLPLLWRLSPAHHFYDSMKFYSPDCVNVQGIWGYLVTNHTITKSKGNHGNKPRCALIKG